jgi:hypothetical protein
MSSIINQCVGVTSNFILWYLTPGKEFHIFLSWTFLVVFPLSFAITALLSPILWPLVIKDFFDKSVKDYNDNKQEYMRRWCFQLLKEFSAKNIEKVIYDTYLNVVSYTRKRIPYLQVRFSQE